jgi:hypothetical protein
METYQSPFSESVRHYGLTWCPVLAGLLVCSNWALAQSSPVPMAPGLDPVAVYVGRSTTVTVVTQIRSTPNLVPNSVRLARTNEFGSGWVDLGQMYDDGTHADALAGDGLFTIQVTLSETSRAQIGFVASVAYQRQLLRVKSGVSLLSVVEPLASVVERQLADASESGGAFFERGVQILSVCLA